MGGGGRQEMGWMGGGGRGLGRGEGRYDGREVRVEGEGGRDVGWMGGGGGWEMEWMGSRMVMDEILHG